MPDLWWQQPADVPPDPDGALDALLTGQPVPDGAGTGLSPAGGPAGDLRLAADLLAALTAPGEGSELAGREHILAEFRRLHAGRAASPAAGSLSRTAARQIAGPAARTAARQAAGPAARPADRRPAAAGARPRSRLRATLLTARATAVVAAALITVTCGGLAAAAYTRSLPAPLQRLAHLVAGAPAGERPPAVPPDGHAATGRSAAELCSAYPAARSHGTPAQQAAAWRRLAAAAGGAANVAGYCLAAHAPAVTPPSRSAQRPGRPAPAPGRRPAVPAPHRRNPSGHAAKPEPGRPRVYPTLPQHLTHPPHPARSHPASPAAKLSPAVQQSR